MLHKLHKHCPRLLSGSCGLRFFDSLGAVLISAQLGTVCYCAGMSPCYTFVIKDYKHQTVIPTLILGIIWVAHSHVGTLYLRRIQCCIWSLSSALSQECEFMFALQSRQSIFTLERCIIDDICIPRGQPGTQSWAKATTCCTTWCRLCDQDGWSQWMRTSSPECQKVLECSFSELKTYEKVNFCRYFQQVLLVLVSFEFVVRIWTSWKWLSELVKQWMSPTEHSGIDLLILRSLAFQLSQFMDMT